MAFVFAVAAPSFAATKIVKRTVTKVTTVKLSPEAQLKALQAKLAKTKTKSARASLMKQIAALQKQIAAKQVVIAPPPPPPPAPVAVPPPPAPAKVAAPAPAPTGLLGMGINTSVELGLVAGMFGVSGNVMLADPMGLGAMVGLPANAVMYKLGVGYAQGNDVNSNTWKAIPITVGGVINLPADMMGGLQTFVGGGVNYVVYRTGQKGGSVGGDIYVGAAGDLGLGGKTYGELGYSILRSGADNDINSYGGFSSKSVTVLIGQSILL